MKDIQAFSCRCVSCLGRLDMLPRFWWTARSKSLRSSRQRSGESFFETRSLDQFWRLHNFLSPGCGNGRRRERLQCCPSWTGDPGVACLPQDCWRGWGDWHIFILFWLILILIILYLHPLLTFWFLFMIHLQSETRQYCSLEAMEPVTSTSIWNPTVSQAITSPLYEIQVRLCNQVLSQDGYLVCSKDKKDKR